ncbi:MAG: hypothetical protein AAF702_34715 [Chloroflexota bacterium]
MLLTDGAHDWPIDLWRSHLEEARHAVGEWGYVIVLVRLDDLDPERWQHFMDLCTELALTPLVRLATTHMPGEGWSAPPVDQDGSYKSVAEDVTDLLSNLAWPPVTETGGNFVIVGNEPNRGDEWGGRPNPPQYARFLLDVADALHKADPDLYILNAGFDLYAPHTGSLPLEAGYFMDAETFMDEMVAAYPDVFTHLDAWASHSYPLGPFKAEPSYQVYQRDMVHDAENPAHLPPPEGLYNRGVNGYEWELFKLATYGITDLPVIITETGWRHQESVWPNAADALPDLPDTTTIAKYMKQSLGSQESIVLDESVQSVTPWLLDDRVEGAIFFAFDGYPQYWGHTNWLILDDLGQVKGRYESLFQALR